MAVASVVFAAPAQAAVHSTTYLNTYEKYVVSAVNKERALRGLRPLTYRYCPDIYAERLAAKLRTSSTLYHQSMYPPLRWCHASRAAENIARASYATPTQLVQMWMRSPAHRANVLDPYLNEIGVATSCSSAYCTTVADFIRR